MTTLLVILGLSFCFCVGLTPAVRTLAARFGLVDQPDGRRKIHSTAIPVAGGIAILISATIALIIALLAPNPFAPNLREQGVTLRGLLLASVVICVVGLLDDYRGLRGRHKLIGQALAVTIMISSGVLVSRVRLFNWDVDLGLLAIPFTAFWLLGAINSLNLIDGMDGMLSCVGLIVSLTMVAMAFIGGQWVAACVAIALAGALLGFLCHNFPPATIFLGDCGSMLIGLVVGVLAIHSCLKGPATIALAAPVVLLTIPIFDTTAAILRRWLTGRSLYTTDRGHLHHCLQRRGLSNRLVLLCVSLLALLTGAGALVTLAFNNELYAILAALAVVGILITFRIFGYAEFLLIRDHVVATASSFFRMHGNGETRETEVRLQGSADWKELWNELTAFAAQLNLRAIRLDVNAPAIHEGYHAKWHRDNNHSEEGDLWRAEIPLVAHGQTVGRLELMGQRDDDSYWMKIARLAKLVDRVQAVIAESIVTSHKGANGTASPHHVNGRDRVKID